MDELTAALAGSFEISHEPNKTSAPHPRYSQYKQKSSNSDQDSRRKKLLEMQKSRRFDAMNHVRKLTDDDWQTEDGDADESEDKDVEKESEESMDVEVKLHKPGRYYKDQLMLSEWLVEVPSDFETEWITLLCPVARRCLVVASRGTTRAFTKSGYCTNSFPSHLPGGCRRNSERGTTILDCLYCEDNQTYYILDLMCWNGHSVYDTETEFRFYWLHEKLQEFPQLQEVSKVNPMKFVGLPSFRCTQEDISTAVSSATFEIDGILFYHKRTHYTFGSTPLVVWLKPYMLEEILGISVPINQMSHKPQDYTNYADHMKKVEEDKEKYAKQKEERLKQGLSPHGGCRGRGRGRGSGRGRGRGRGRGGKDSEMETSHIEAEGDLDGGDIPQETVEKSVNEEKCEDESSHDVGGMEVLSVAS